MTEYLSTDDVVDLYIIGVRANSDEPQGLRDRGLLESAVMRPQFLAHYGDADLFEQAAALVHGISQSQSFVDGNKRAALQAVSIFLRINGPRLTQDRTIQRCMTLYPHLPVPLRQLTGDALLFWGVPAWREHLLHDILSAPDPMARARALQVVDDAVTQGLAAFGFPRAPVRSLSLVMPRLQDELGTKYATCDLQIGQPAMRRELSPGGSPDGIVETWIHESMHGRRFPWRPNARLEVRFPGYEEGLAEGVTRLISRQVGLVPGLQAYGRYVQAYEVLARVIGVGPETIYRGLHRLPNGSVMDGFVSEIDAIRVETGEPPLTVVQRGRLDRVAHRLFARAYFRDSSSARSHNSIRQAWRRALR